MEINPTNEHIIPTLEYDLNTARYKNYKVTYNFDDY